MIIALEEAKLELNNFREHIVELGNALRIDSLREQANTLEEKSQSPDFWNDQEKSTKALQTLKQLKDKIERYENLCTKLDDTITMAELAIEENDESLTEEILSDVAAIKAATEQVQQAFYKVSEKLYQQANPQGAQGCDPNCGGNCGGDGVVDADYETVD